ncbi:MAG TPA: nitroreductase family protein [Anaerolineales bacterium]|nr:nitroreductase family protein [Anaerolineales bacterium]
MILDLIRRKRAVRDFLSQPVPEEIVRDILEAGRLAQSSKNDQPWNFILIRDRETLRQLSTCGRYAGHMAGADFAIGLVMQPGYDFDMGQSAAYMQLAAWDHGVGSCIASMWEPDRAKAILGIPAEKQFDTAISFGYPAKKPGRIKDRRPLEDLVRVEKWS